MGRFRGSFDYSIDAKGRVNIPAKFRKCLNPEADETFVVVRGPTNCLRAYPQDLWDAYEDELASRPETPETLRHKRLLFSLLSDSTLDSQGRITLTAKQMVVSGIKKEVTLIGQSNYIEIWDRVKYEEYLLSADDFDEMFFQSVEAGLKSQ
ncbi:division/cell wall cluster transcriptional repressor MraZ [Chitinispirillales bacterium ANBcel5]|uniref:division/cell wall cluster transcriptional repressor MraZ n=1 Tax=Cellulosispirillum alkaliphilum TaxID=3039283 RepID=UPI002A586EDF|nr:division/cell wall cluster transcriptional repressor MraZ [Chitinispirillales bacterium ANBcel5]